MPSHSDSLDSPTKSVPNHKLVLNDLMVKSAKQGIYWDSKLRGFGLRVGKNRRTWLVLVGSGRRKRIGLYPFMTTAQAREHATRLLAQKALGAIAPRATAFEDARRDYLAEAEKRLRPSTVHQAKWLLNKLDFGRKSIGDITGAHMNKILSAQTRSNRDHLWRTSQAFFKWAYRNHLIDRSPLERLQPAKQSRVRERILTEEEMTAVYKEACKATTPMHLVVWLLCRLGQRPGEIRNLNRNWIYPDKIVWPPHATKNGRQHTIPISEETYKFLEEIPVIDESDYVFPAGVSHVRGKPTTVMKLGTKRFNEFRKACGVTDWQLRDLRKTMATGWQRLGIRLEVTEAALNHFSGSRAGIVQVYQRHHYYEEMKHAYQLWEDYLEKLLHLPTP